MEYNPLAVVYTATAVALLLSILATIRTIRNPGGIVIGLSAFMWLMTAAFGWFGVTAPNRAAWEPGATLTAAQEEALEAEREALGLPFTLELTFDRFQDEILGERRYQTPNDPALTIADYVEWVEWSADLLETFSLDLARSDPWCDSFTDHLIALRLLQSGETLDYAVDGAVLYHQTRVDVIHTSIRGGGFGGTVLSCLVKAQGDEATRLTDAQR